MLLLPIVVSRHGYHGEPMVPVCDSIFAGDWYGKTRRIELGYVPIWTLVCL